MGRSWLVIILIPTANEMEGVRGKRRMMINKKI